MITKPKIPKKSGLSVARQKLKELRAKKSPSKKEILSLLTQLLIDSAKMGIKIESIKIDLNSFGLLDKTHDHEVLELFGTTNHLKVFRGAECKNT